MDRKKLIRQIVEKIKTEYLPQKIIIFGSYAWGNPTKDSDLDLFIIKDVNEKHKERALKVRRILGEENGIVAMDILVYTPEELSKRIEIGDSFISKILKKGEIVYG